MSYLWHALLCDSNPLSRELAKVAEPFVKQEDEGKFRCKTCQKLFKATSFVEKHIANKHPELVKALDDVSALGSSIPFFTDALL